MIPHNLKAIKARSNVPNTSPNIEVGKKAKTFQCSIEGGQMHRTFHQTFRHAQLSHHKARKSSIVRMRGCKNE